MMSSTGNFVGCNKSNEDDYDEEENNDEMHFLAPLRNGNLLVPSSSLSTSTSTSSSSSSLLLLPKKKNRNKNAENTNSTEVTNVNNKQPTLRDSQQIPAGWIPLHHRRIHKKGDNNNKRNRNITDKKIKDDDDDDDDDDAIILGRSDFLSSMFTACGCSKNLKSSRKKCIECRSVLSWAGNLSRETLKVDVSNIYNDNDNDTINTADDADVTTATATATATTAVDQDAVTQISFRVCLVAVLILNEDDDDTFLSEKLAYKKWTKNRTIRRGMRISLRYEEENLDFSVVSRKDIVNTRVNINACGESNIDNNNNCSSSSKMDNSTTANNSNSNSNSNNKNKTENDPARSRIVNALFNLVDDHNRINKKSLPQQQHSDVPRLCQSSQTKRKACNNSDDDNDDSNNNIDNVPTSDLKRIWFCPRGQDMPRKRIEILIDRLLSLNGSYVDGNCDPSKIRDCDVHASNKNDTGGTQRHNSTIPRPRFKVVDRYIDATYWIISERVSDLASVAKATNDNATKEILGEFLDTNEVTCVKPSWLDSLFSSSSSSVLPPPSAKDRWYGYVPKRKQQRQANTKRQRVCKDKEQQPIRNLKISECFLKLSKIYEQTPFLKDEDMKARQYHLIAGRLQNIDFDIQYDASIRQLREIPFVGASTAQMIQEILQTGRLRRLDSFRKDPTRIAMRNLLAIWGIGQATALNLINREFFNIDQVREGISTGNLTDLDQRQLIGVQCYEEFLEDMNRNEVETIFEQIRTEAKKILPDCDAEIMGSYRRGKTELGDLDVFIVSKQYMNKIPVRLLPELVNNLWRNGHIAHHLTNLPGLQTESYTNSQEGSLPKTSHSTLPSSKNSYKKSKPEKLTGCATYMGVYFSPTKSGKRRRVDIKIWPYIQKPYASLYFTGGKYFNRSMRLYAKRKFNWKLNDKGLFDLKTGERVITTVCTEKDLFDKLQLIYKAPRDRKFFDDVHPIAASI